MARRFVIGVDFGTLSARAILADVETGAIAACATREYAHGVIQDAFPPTGEKLAPGWCLQYPDDYVDSLIGVVKGMMEESGVAPEFVIGISVDFTACTLVPLDKSGEPMCHGAAYKDHPHAYVKLWKHHAAQPYADEINEKLESFPNDVAAHYGKRISSEILLPKLMQILREDPRLYADMDCICEASDWINMLLTGRMRRSVSTAGYKAMYFNGKGFPDREFFARIDPGLRDCMTTKLRGDVCGITERFGELNGVWAEKLGLKAGTSVGCGIIDAHAGVPGSGIFRPGQMMLALGTSSVQAALCKKVYSEYGVIGAIKDAVIPGYYLWESGLAAVGDLLMAFASQLNGGESIDTLTQKAAYLRPGESGLVALDWWNGNKTPFVDNDLSGVVAGLRLGTKAEEVFLALIESTAFATKRITEVFENAGASVDQIIACGGIVDKNPLLMQVYADVLGREILVAGCDQTMALGSGIYASVAAGSERGGYDRIEDAVTHMTHLDKRKYVPRAEYKDVYERLYGIYARLSACFGREYAQTMHELGQIALGIRPSD